MTEVKHSDSLTCKKSVTLLAGHESLVTTCVSPFPFINVEGRTMVNFVRFLSPRLIIPCYQTTLKWGRGGYVRFVTFWGSSNDLVRCPGLIRQ